MPDIDTPDPANELERLAMDSNLGEPPSVTWQDKKWLTAAARELRALRALRAEVARLQERCDDRDAVVLESNQWISDHRGEVARLTKEANIYASEAAAGEAEVERLRAELVEAVGLIRGIPERSALGMFFWERANAFVAKHKDTP